MATDPFAASGGGVYINGGWIPKNNPAALAAAGYTGGTTTTPGGVIGAPAGSAANSTITWTPGAAPAWTGPSKTPTFTPMEKFTYGSFTAPGATGMYADPGYQWRFDQGRQAVDASAAARGTLRGGNTLADLVKYGQGLASQEYGNVWNRALDAYKTNYDVASGVYDTNRTERDAGYDAAVGDYNRDLTERTNAYKPAYDTWVATNAAAGNNALLNYQRPWEAETYYADDAYRRWRDEMDNTYRWGVYRGDDAWRRERAPIQDKQFLASLGAGMV